MTLPVSAGVVVTIVPPPELEPPPQLTVPKAKTSTAIAPQPYAKRRCFRAMETAVTNATAKSNNNKPNPLGGGVLNLRHQGVCAALDAVIVTVVVPDVLTVVLGKEHVTPDKLLATVQAKETVPENPRIEPTVIVEVVELPG